MNRIPSGMSAPGAAHLDLLLTLTQIPTAAGREWRVIDFLHAWTAARPDLSINADAAGNLTIAPKQQWRSGGAPVLITAHLDHPAFVVERIIAPTLLELAFRGGVLDPYFDRARVAVHTRATGSPAALGGQPVRSVEIAPLLATLTQKSLTGPTGFNHYLAELDPSTPDDLAATIRPGDVATWHLPPAEIDAQGLVHTHACDDLAAAAAALAAFDDLRATGAPTEDVRLLFTRAEEIGFTGALAACKLGTIPRNARVIALENSRSFADSPIGSGPIVRVGDRLSIFDPRLTAACAKRAEDIAAATTPIPWQRKLMAGGACEATVFCAYGYSATCLCLPLGNYHNMADLQSVQDKTYDTAKGPPQIAREFIHKNDYLGLISLLTAIGTKLPENAPIADRLESLYTKHKQILEER